jgi:hypothetical protein
MPDAFSPFVGLPGAELVGTGLTDLARGEDSVEARLVMIGLERLRAADVPIPDGVRGRVDAEARLYESLCANYPDRRPHSELRALVRRLESFERAAEVRQTRQRQRLRDSAAPAPATSSDPLP